MRIAFATCSQFPDGGPDDAEVAELAGAHWCCWDDAAVEWDSYDRVIIRSTWDYTARPQEFLQWCLRVGAERLRNSPELVAFNLDKRYLAELSVASVPTQFIAPGDPPPQLSGEVVVKPSVSAGARRTGRFGAGAHGEAYALIERINASGQAALVQRYLDDVEQHGETTLIYMAGELSHVGRKRAILRPDEVAPTTGGELSVAVAMLAQDLVVPSSASTAEVRLGDELLREISARFGTPLYARVDLIRGPAGAPLLLELEVVEPVLYLECDPSSSSRLADCIGRC